MGLRSVHPKGLAVHRSSTRSTASVAALLILLFAPLMAAIALAVRTSSPGPIVFRQRRVGRDGTVFDLFKFRSMRLPDPAAEGFRPGADSAPGGVEGNRSPDAHRALPCGAHRWTSCPSSSTSCSAT